mgnify:CR=1 FL=1|jgi:hypothetical protein|tara:strand:- start:113 stop:649 length:537 start_codon:yes stop_codon:yes gene_type:complete
MSEEINWSPESMLEITLKQPDDFLKIRETLSRMGVASRKDKTLFQSCHILHKQGKYYIVHFKELFALDGKKATLIHNDIQRRNTIACLLQDWSLLSIVKQESAEDKSPLSQIKIIAFKEKGDWNLQAKYNIGKKIVKEEEVKPTKEEEVKPTYAEEDTRPSDTEPKEDEIKPVSMTTE